MGKCPKGSGRQLQADSRPAPASAATNPRLSLCEFRAPLLGWPAEAYRCLRWQTQGTYTFWWEKSVPSLTVTNHSPFFFVPFLPVLFTVWSRALCGGNRTRRAASANQRAFSLQGYAVESVIGKELGPLSCFVQSVATPPARCLGLEEIELLGAGRPLQTPPAALGACEAQETAHAAGGSVVTG